MIDTITRDRVRNQRGAGIPITADQVGHALGEDLLHLLHHPHRRGGSGVRRLEHDRVACGQCWGELPDRHHHGVVPGRYLTDRTARLPAHVGREALSCTPPADLPSSTRAAPAKKRIWSSIGTISSDKVTENGLPVFSRLDAHQLLGIGLDEVGQL